MTRLDLGISFIKNSSPVVRARESFSYIKSYPICDTFVSSTKRKISDKEMLDFIKEAKQCYKKQGISRDKCLTTNLLEFITQSGKIDEKLKKLVLRIMHNEDINLTYLDSFIETVHDKNYSRDVRRVLLSLFRKVETDTPLDKPVSWKNLGNFINKRIALCESQEEVLKLVKKIRMIMSQASTSNEAEDFISNWENLSGVLLNSTSNFRNHDDADSYLNKMILSGVVPTKGLTEVLRANGDCALSMLQLLINSKFRLLNLDDAALTQILNNTSSNIRRVFMQELAQVKDRTISMKTDRFNPEQYLVSVGDRNLIFDKKTEDLLAKMTVDAKDILIQDYNNRRLIQSSYDICDGYASLENKTIEKEMLNEESIFTQAPFSGQMDVFRIIGDKVQVLSRAVTNPVNGEICVKQDFQSPEGVKLKSKLIQKRNGSYNYTYSIKDKSGKQLLEVKRTYKIIDEDNFVSTVNGEIYEIFVSGDLLSVRTKGKTVTINLKKLVPSGDEKIIDMIKHLPGDELISLKKSKLKKVIPYFDSSESSAHRDGEIRLGNNHRDNAFVFLHELGHHKAQLLDSSALKNIITVYNKELAAYKSKVTPFELCMVDHMIDNTEHYLNSRHGAVEEVIADVNAILKCVCMEKGIAERILVLQEMFPETMAEIAKYL